MVRCSWEDCEEEAVGTFDIGIAEFPLCSIHSGLLPFVKTFTFNEGDPEPRMRNIVLSEENQWEKMWKKYGKDIMKYLRENDVKHFPQPLNLNKILSEWNSVDNCLHNGTGGEGCWIREDNPDYPIKCGDCNQIFESPVDFAEDIITKLMKLVRLHIKSACNFYLKYVDDPELLREEYEKCGLNVEHRIDIEEFLDENNWEWDIKEYNKWLFNLAFKDALNEEVNK